ncbi:MAG: ABC transporter ATP-binding protein [Phycisphaerales bacterium]
MPPTHTPLVRVEHLRKTYKLGRVKVPVLHGVSIDVAPNESVAILGASGSGKSTLLHLVGGLDRPDRHSKNLRRCRRCGYDTAGLEPGELCPECAYPVPSSERAKIFFDGRDVTAMSAAQLNRYRARDVGFVFQFYHLLPELSVLQNVTVGAMIRHGLAYTANAAEARKHARDLLEAFGLAHRLRHRPAQLSGGERQRVAIARALVNKPRLLLADEPTGNLDAETGAQILDALGDLRQKFGLTMLMVTHDPAVAQRADRVVRLHDGVIQRA